ncbi:MAG: hypothetical protein BECKG1743D_GA0114223_112152 [Candidatus Kentron sp. G]|nr:MAG: hypothetical protein BECKG1743F_GA0114225_112352 [Candidatus Kentron sp. G]VFN07522.1 MAG: hypothetical protein BECKG1743E_GA0114224_112302 [Candidatus Kentron sp. G]VFN07968.1 MAG: hypothetical protein BECKG1743D_GA0114223_112152 [Candidatus Kentron sp. G]
MMKYARTLFVFPLIGFFIGSTAIYSNVSSEAFQPYPSRSARASQPPLNSERIRTKFGNYGIEVLTNGEKISHYRKSGEVSPPLPDSVRSAGAFPIKSIRVSSLYSTENGEKTTRTLAIVVYPGAPNPSLSEEHKAILHGESIGEVFKKNGWQIEKQHLLFGEIEASPKFAQIYARMGNIMPSKLAIHRYRLFVSRNDAGFHYATITELHHPEYLDAGALRAIYKAEFERRKSKDKDYRTILEIAIERIENR